ncbi:squalene--hopene cyclase [Fodinisporobacter ferrooxydans]|uniref:Squalene--hopene cyclase n=1 Tax=Fodinisporobacter ferrooxydans TaxID=2901836 RepID=A0ABY4CIJ9_9BACL|nr:squalene--hopene cyclase [Alicyclobacillaceae bacterium MYW30-H2]
MIEKIDAAISGMSHEAIQRQVPDGSFRFCYESGLMTDAYMIFVLRTLLIHDEDLIQALAERILSLQEPAGVWKLFHDEEEGNLSATLEAYYALLASGVVKETDERISTARQFILAKGGMNQCSLITQAMLALTGQYPWPAHLRFPLEFLLLPASMPVNFYEFAGFARAHLLPVMLASDKTFSIKSTMTPDISYLDVDSAMDADSATHRHMRSLHDLLHASVDSLQQFFQNLKEFPQKLHEHAVATAKQYMLERIETDGTFYGYASSTYLLIYAWLSLGYPKEHDVIRKAIRGLRTLAFPAGTTIHIQNTTSTVWDTALLTYALQEAGMSERSPIIRNAGRYLQSSQHNRPGDWKIHNPDGKPGGWGFSDANTMNPDVDDTSAALRAIRSQGIIAGSAKHAFERGNGWLISMQNDDGGWPAFEKNTDSPILGSIAVDGTKNVLIDPSSVDLTGRTLDYLGSIGHSGKEPMIEKGVRWLLAHQEPNGSWYGRWGVCYIYGTWAAVTGLRAVGVDKNHPALQKALRWLLHIQNADGGWGESCKSDQVRKFVSLGSSTPSQTAWAVDALVAILDEPVNELDRGIRRLTGFAEQNESDWRITYPTGAGLPGNFYTHYHSYRYIWPMLALAHYKKKYQYERRAK